MFNASHHLVAGCILLATSAVMVGCSEQQPTTDRNFTSEVTTSDDARPRNLAWLGGTARPAVETLAIVDPDNENNELFPGGLVVHAVEPGGQLSQMKLREGDVIVGVGNEMLPNKEDPTTDFIQLVEGEVSAEQDRLVLKYMRGGKLLTAETPIDLAPLEQGLPLKVERYADQARRGLQFLLAQQNEDGSFSPAADDPNAKIIVTSLCGLALRTGSEESQTAANQCLEFVLSQLDANATLDPLAASYALVLLVEMAPPPANMPQIGICLGTIMKSQQNNGGWLANVSEESEARESDGPDVTSQQDNCDVRGTFATNQILLSLAIAERNGIAGKNGPIEKAVAYLKSQAEARIASPIDRRIKAGLSAGTAAALIALNVDRSDALITRLAKESLRLAEDIPYGRALSVPHTLSAAILSRQLGVNAWIDHHRHAKLLVTQRQLSDGSFEAVLGVKSAPLDVERACDNENWRTAHYCLLLQLQNQKMAAFATEKSHPTMVARAGDGTRKKDTGEAETTATLSGGLQLDFDPTGMSPEELKEKMLEKLKEQGIEIDGASVQIMSTTSRVPPGDAPKDKDKD